MILTAAEIAAACESMPCECNPETGEKCGFHGNWQYSVPVPAMHGFDTPAAKYDAQIYRRHNITHESTSVMSDGATVTARPIPASDGCKCGNCAAHTKRAAITGVAEPGKNR